jgi:hypothetical protein
MKKLTHIIAKTESNETLIHFEIPYYSEIQKIEYDYNSKKYLALILIDESLGIRSLKNQTKIETYQSIGLNQELDGSTGTKLIIVTRNNSRQVGYHDDIDYGDVYLLKKIVEPKDDLDRAQDIFEFYDEKEWTEDDELCNFCCNATIYYFKVKEIIKRPRLKWKVIALNSLIKMRNDWFRVYPDEIPF